MISRAHNRDSIYHLWRVKDPYRNKVTNCIEVKSDEQSLLQLVPPHLKYDQSQKDYARTITNNQLYLSFETWLSALTIIILFHLLLNQVIITSVIALLVIVGFEFYRKRRLKKFNHLKQQELYPENAEINYLNSICKALMSAMKRCSMLSPSCHQGQINIGVRSSGSARIILQTTIESDNKQFLKNLKELLGAVSNQKYIVGRSVLKAQKPGDTDLDDHINSTYENYLNGTLRPESISYHPLPQIFAKSKKGREAFVHAWNKYVSVHELLEADKRPDLVALNFGRGPSVQDREIWD